MTWTPPPFIPGVVWQDLPSQETPVDAIDLNLDQSAEATYAATVGSSVASYADAEVATLRSEVVLATLIPPVVIASTITTALPSGSPVTSSIVKPTCEVGDLLVLQVLTNTSVTTGPTGFSLTDSVATNDAGNYLYQREVDGTEGSTFTVTLGTSTQTVMTCITVRGWSGAALTTGHSASTSASPSARVTTPSENCLVLGFEGSADVVSISSTPPSLWTELQDQNAQYGYRQASVAWYAAAAVGPITATFSLTGGTPASSLILVAIPTSNYQPISKAEGTNGGGFWVTHLAPGTAPTDMRSNQLPFEQLPAKPGWLGDILTPIKYGIPNGLPGPLDANGQLPVAQVPSSTVPAHGSTHEPGASDDVYMMLGNGATGRIETIDRSAMDSNCGLVGGTAYYTYFTCQTNITVSGFKWEGGTAGTGITVWRMTLLQVNNDGSMTPLAENAQGTSTPTGSTEHGPYAFDTGRGLAATVVMTRGQRYAVGMIQVGTTPTKPCGKTLVLGSVSGYTPRIGSTVTGQADGPTTTVAAPVSSASNLTTFLVYFSLQ